MFISSLFIIAKTENKSNHQQEKKEKNSGILYTGILLREKKITIWGNLKKLHSVKQIRHRKNILLCLFLWTLKIDKIKYY